MNKIKTFSYKNAEAFDAAVNEFGATHNVFATQSHVNVTTSEPFKIIYTAVVFYKEAQ